MIGLFSSRLPLGLSKDKLFLPSFRKLCSLSWVYIQTGNRDVISGLLWLQSLHCSNTKVFAVYTSMPLSILFPLPGKPSLNTMPLFICYHTLVLQVLAQITSSRKPSLTSLLWAWQPCLHLPQNTVLPLSPHTTLYWNYPFTHLHPPRLLTLEVQRLCLTLLISSLLTQCWTKSKLLLNVK